MGKATGVLQGTSFSWSCIWGGSARCYLPFGDDIDGAEIGGHFGNVARDISSLESSVERFVNGTF